MKPAISKLFSGVKEEKRGKSDYMRKLPLNERTDEAEITAKILTTEQFKAQI